MSDAPEAPAPEQLPLPAVPEKAPPPADPDEPPDESAPKPAPTPAPEPKPEPASYVAEVMKQRDVSQLAELVREKKALEATAAKYKGSEGKLATLAKIERLMDDGDDDEAMMELLRFKHGDKAAERLAPAYNGLTKRILGVQADPHVTRVEQRVTRQDQEVEALKSELAQARAERQEREAKDHEDKVRGAVKQLATILKEHEATYPHLMAEADSPEEVVWGILEEAHKHSQELSLQDAIKLADDHFKPAFERKASRYQNLLAPNKANGVPTKPEAPKLTAPPRKSLTNAAASHAPNEKTLPPPKNEAERLSRSFAVLQQGGLKR